MSDQNGRLPTLDSDSKKVKKSKEEIKIFEKREKERKEEVIASLLKMDVDDIKCGLAGCTPTWFQALATTEVYLIVYCIVGLFIGMFFTYSVSTISTYEKRFKLTSKHTGFMLSGNDISQVLLGVIVSYYGNYGNRPRWVAVGCFLSTLSSVLAALPHFIYGPGEDAIELFSMSEQNLSSSITFNTTSNKKMLDFCHSPYEADCELSTSAAEGEYSGPVLINFLSQFIVGFSVTLVYTIGFAYMDDNVNKKESPIYYSVSYIIRVVGPVLGYFLGSQTLAHFIIPSYKPNISTRDPRWLGAWWLGYLILSVMLAFSGFLLLFFPRTLPISLYDKLKVLHAKENVGNEKEFSAYSDLHSLYQLSQEREEYVKPSLKKLPFALVRLLKNKIFIGNTFSYTFYLLGFFSYWTFKPKYLEFQFRKSASEATLYAGIASLIASVLGLLISGVIIKILKPGSKAVALYSLVIAIWNPIMMICLMLIGCPNLDINGPMTWSPGLGSCNSVCDCSDKYSPVCSNEGRITYYSSCYAGCSGVNTDAYPVEYYNCSCAPSTTVDIFHEDGQAPNATNFYNSFYPTSLGGNVTQGYCPEDCNAFFYYVIVIVVGKIITATSRIGATLLFMRSIEERDKGLALGFTTVIISLFAFIPAPIMMGAIVDSACIIWDNTCGVSGNCWLYDSDKFRIIIHLVPAVLLIVSIFGDIIVYLGSDGIILYEDTEEKETRERESHQGRELTPLTSEEHNPQASKELIPLTSKEFTP